jgi:hypothetical protein
MIDIANEMILIIGIGLALWAAWATVRLNEIGSAPEDIAEQVEEIQESILIVTTILSRLGELMPQFTIQTNPLQPIIDYFMQNLTNQSVDKDSASKRDSSSGQFQEMIQDGEEKGR